MGCDIHLYQEQKIDGQWKSADVWSDKYKEGRASVAYDDMAYYDRNYNLFAILADVRNGRGFAGVNTGAGFNPIAQPKGLPDDISEQVRAEAKYWQRDGHSHSWLTLREVLDYDWNQKTTLSGLVDARNFDNWKRRGAPESWCGAVFGSAVRKVTHSEMEAAIAAGSDTKGMHCEVEWVRYYHQCAGSFWKAICMALHKAAPEDVRFVFWFDN